MSHKDHTKNRPAPQFAESSFLKPKPKYVSSSVPTPRGFTWDKQRKKALKHQFTRSIHLARTNIDYQVEHPNECRDNPDHKVLADCHPEAQKRLLLKHEKLLLLSVVPAVDRPTRLNRVG